MKFAKFAALAVAMLIGSAVFADAANVCVMFSTPGPDKYRDGTEVVDGEWYALVWLAEGATFTGVATTATSEVMLAAPLAKGGKCPLGMFQLDSAKAKTTGSYKGFLLDTRNGGTTPAAATSTIAQIANIVKAAEISSDIAAGSATVASTVSATDRGAFVSADGTSESVVVKAVEVVGAKVHISVTNLDPSLKYQAVFGTDVNKLESTQDISTTDGTAEVYVDADKANFLKVISK